MKQTYITLTLLLTLWAGMLQAAPYSYSDREQGFYFAATGALSVPTDEDYSNALTSGEIDSKVGFGVTAAVGYEWNSMRFELEYAHRSNNGEINTAAGRTDTDFNINSLMINVLYDFYLNDALYWYNGAGIGVAWVGLESGNVDETDAEFAWQLMTGLGYDISEQVALTFGYRLFTTRDGDYSGINADTPFLSNFEFGVRYNF